MREDGSNIFDIHAKPLRDTGIGGVFSFGIGYDKICWETCDANGFGERAQLAKTHLGLSENCSALTKKVRTYDCNCKNEPKKTCTRSCHNSYYYCCFGNLRRCSNRCVDRECSNKCTTRIFENCNTCTEVIFVNENDGN